MEAFNIKINVAAKEITLTILPQDDEYKIIYFGGIIGALKQGKNHFDFVKPENVVPGTLPLYKYKQTESAAAEAELKLTKVVLTAIINEVELVLSTVLDNK